MDIKTLSLDLETRSSVDISKCGAYKYAESPDFDILLFGVSVNHGSVRVYDLASGETVPEEILAALADNAVIKTAFNASFERVCLSGCAGIIPSTSAPMEQRVIRCGSSLILPPGDAR